MEHTFGDGEMSFEQVEEAKHESLEEESGFQWLNSKASISLSTDSMFNLHDEEVKQLLIDD